MKKILTVSIMAVMAVTAANAEIASRAYVDAQDNGVKAIVGALNELTAGGFTDADKTSVAKAANAAMAKANTASGDLSSLTTRVSTAEGKLDTLTGDDEGSVAKAEADAKAYADDSLATALAGLSGTNSKSAGADGLALSVVQEDGLIVDITGSIAANTYDAYGAAASAQTAAEQTAAADATTKANAAEAAAKSYADGKFQTTANLTTTLDSNSTNTQYPAASTVYNAIEAAKTVSAGALDALDATGTQIKGNQTGNVVVGIAQENGAVSATFGNAVDAVSTASGQTGNVVSAVALNVDGHTIDVTKAIKAVEETKTIGAAGHYVLTADVDNNGVTNYQWELITRNN